jgi:hypothetical protein
VEQRCPVEEPTETALGEAWYGKRVGVELNMLGEPGTTVYVADTPQMEPHPRRPPPGPDEIGGTTIVAHRNCPSTVFVALHEPFQGGIPPTTDYRLIGRSERALGVVVRHDSPDVNDRILLSWHDDKQSHTLGDKYESYVFSGWAFVRIGRRAIEVRGDLKGLKIPAPGTTKLILNGREQKTTVRDGNLCFGELDGI